MIDPTLLAMRILAVDDHPVQLKIFGKILESHGFTNITLETDPLVAIGRHQENRFDLVLLDLDLPGLDGLEAMARFLVLSEGEFLPIIVVTASREANQVVQAFRNGARDFLSRPVHRDELVVRIRHMLECRAKWKKLPPTLRPASPRIPQETVQRGRILVVEDDPSQLVILERMLQFGGFAEVSGVSDPAKLEEHLPPRTIAQDLIVLDLHLPGMEPAEVIAKVLGQDRRRAPLLLAITADEANETRWEAFERGVWDFIQKPVEREIFLAKVENLLGIRLLF